MFRRFSVSIGQPGKIGLFLKDKIVFIIIYIFLLAIFCSIPSVITVCSYKGFTTTTVNEIANVYKSAKESSTDDKKFIPDDVEIVDYKLVGEKKGAFSINDGVFGVGINDSYYASAININFKENGLEIAALSSTIKTYSYEELNLDNLNFSVLDESDGQFTKLVVALEYIVNDTQGIWKTAVIVGDFFSNIAKHLMNMLLLAIVMMFGSFIPFSYLIKITVYSSTIAAVSELIGELYGGPNIGSFIGIILAFIYTTKAMKNIVAIKR